MYFDYWGEIIEEENSKLGCMNISDLDSDYVINLQPIFLSAASLVTIIRYSIKTSPLKKVFNAVWGEGGLDHENGSAYWAYRVTYDSKHNGSYAYSFKLNKWVKLDI